MSSYWNCSIRAYRRYPQRSQKGSERGRHTGAENNSQGKRGTNLHRTLGAFHLEVNTDSFTTQSYAASYYSSRTPNAQDL
jgi:hypothetical protein